MKDLFYGAVGLSIVATLVSAVGLACVSMVLIIADATFYSGTDSAEGVVIARHTRERGEKIYMLEIRLDDGTKWLGDVSEETFDSAEPQDRVILTWDYGKTYRRGRNYRIELIEEKKDG